MNIDKLPYRPCVGIMLINKDKKVFAGKRIDSRSEAWQMPQGGIDEGESPKEAAFRELEEEIGTNNADILTESQNWYNYDLPTELIPNLWDGKYRGQTQKWFALQFKGQDSDIDINTNHPEFMEWKWVEVDILPEIIVSFKKRLYADIVQEFRHLFS